MRRAIIICLFFLIAIQLFAIPNYKDYTKNVPGLDKYPNATAINVLTDIQLNINPDTTYTYEVFYIKKILTYKGKKRYSDVKFIYNADYESIELGDCFTVNQEGEKIPLPPEAIHDSEHYLTLISPDYINFREKIINFPGIEPGYFIIVNYTLKNHRKEFISGVEHLMEENPFLEKHFTINSPKQIKIYYDYKRDLDNLKFTKEKNGDIISYKWVIKNSELIPDEQNAPSYMITGCPIVYSTAKNWKQMSNFLFDRFKKGIYRNREIEDKAREITRNKQSDRDKIFAIYDYIANNFLDKESDITEQDFNPQPLEKIFQQKYGSTRDLTALFIAMANMSDINDCYPAIVLNKADRFSPFQRNNAVRNFIENLVVFWDGILIYPGKDDMRFGYAGVESCNLIIGKKKPQFQQYNYNQDIVDYPKSISFIDKTIGCKLDNNGEDASIDYFIAYFGPQDYKYRTRFRNETEQKRKIWFSQRLKDKSSIITDGPYFENIEDLGKALIIHYKCDISNFFINQGDFIYFKLPGETIPIKSGAKERKTPFQIYKNFSIKEKFIIENITKDFTLIKPAKDVYKNLKLENCQIEYKLEFKESTNGNLTLIRQINIPECLISIDNYKKFTDFISELKQPHNLMVFLKKK